MSLPDTASAVVAQVARRWRQIDPLLPAAGPAAPDCGTTLVVAEHDAAVAVGRCEHWTAEPGSVELSWGAARRFRLSAAVADPDVTGRLGRLLALWRGHLAALPGTGDADTAAVVNWPSRDVDGIERPDTLPALRLQAAGLLAGPSPWTWLAERDGEAVAMLAAQRPEAAGWIAPMTGLAPAAYLTLMFVRPEDRGSGVAGALVDEFHRAAGTAGVAVTLLHYAQLNPLSVPFWSRRGYRPLWTTWQATPARSIS